MSATKKLRNNLLAAACALALCGSAMADVLLLDRGLPKMNANNPVSSSRSNVAWADGGQTTANPTPGDYFVEGDTFTNGSGTNWSINTIRVWTVGAFDPLSLRLLGGLASGPAASITQISNVYTTTLTPYPAGGPAQYENSDGSSSPLTAVDFAVNLMLAAGEEFLFFLDGTGGRQVVPFMHASNAALSGLPQDDADGLIWEARIVGGVTTTTGSFDATPYWDKSSDFNVQVVGNAVPEPGTLALLGLGLAGVAVIRKRKQA